MEKPTYILAVLDHTDTDSRLLAKASGLARRFRARLELFLCDAEHAYALKHEYEPSHSNEVRRSCMAQAMEYLAQLQTSADLQDVQTSITAGWESPLYEGIVRKVLQSRPDLVIKSAGSVQFPASAEFDPNDWQLMRKCPATLLMTRGRMWHARPRFAAAVDVSAEETVGLASSILETAETLRAAHEAELDVLYAERGGVGRDTREARAAALRKLAQQSHVDDNDVHILEGDPERTLPAFLRDRDYDVLTLGALTHRHGAVTLVGTLTSKLVDAVDCDFVLVKPKPRQSSVDAGTVEESRPFAPLL
jgi:universal stress protein E